MHMHGAILKQRFGDLTLPPSSRLLSWTQSVELVPGSAHQSQSQSYFTTGSLPPIHLGDKPLETPDKQFSLQLNTCGRSPM
jgi:hypothetical protein